MSKPRRTLLHRRWAKFRANRRGYWSLLIFTLLFVVSLGAELVSNDHPFVVNYQGGWYFPIVQSYPETTFGGDFATETNYRDPYILEKLSDGGNWAIFPPNHYSYATINTNLNQPVPSPPTSENFLGTDDQGRDVLARLLYGFRLSVLFGLGLTLVGTLLGIAAGAVMGYFGGRTDLLGQRFIEIWSAMPELYLLIIFAAIFKPSLGLLLILLSMFGWMGLVRLRPGRVPERPQSRLRPGRPGPGGGQPDHHVPASPPQRHDPGDHLPALPDVRGDPGPDQPGFSRSRRPAAQPQPG